ncbi:MAG TPA: protein kinase [Vicinamibacteria bacterium]|nr:protein kinase [Vicinamibacteria bacterium]
MPVRPPALAPSTRLGPYEILAPVGAGGMGEVYRAKDTRLEREVAVKVLSPELDDEQFRARFEREAKAVSALNHPHICTLHDVGREAVNGSFVNYLVLELIEGESLAARLAKGPLTFDQVIRHGVEIAAALDAAHRRGIVHRDLKPANVMLTRSGAKLLDFGLARPGGPVNGKGVVDSALPTAEDPLTEQGTILGTFQYMAPEQLEGQPADARTDIFAFGALLFEMATAKKAFDGKSRTSLIAAIVSSEPPPISQVTPMAPPALDHVVRKCLEKDPDDRWQSARDVMSELQWIQEGGSRAGVPAAVVIRRKARERIAWAAFAVALLAAVGLGIGYVRRAPRPPQMVAFGIALPETLSQVGPPAVSPDGRVIVFDAVDQAGRSQIWVRSLDSVELRALPGTEGGARPFWSPDGKFVAFIAGGKLKKVDIGGGPAQTLADTPTGSDGTWSTTGVILFDGRAQDPIFRVPAGGGVPKPEITPDPKSKIDGVGWPEFLPDGKHFLYTRVPSGQGDLEVVVRTLDSTEEKTLLKTSSRVLFAPPGHLVYVREKTLVAQPFDTKTLALSGDPIPLGEGLGVDNVGLANFSLSQNGVLAYRSGDAGGFQLVWYSRDGKESPAMPEPAEFGDMWLSPDGRRLVFEDRGTAKPDLWIRDLVRGTTSRFTFDAATDACPVWSPDGARIVFSSDRKGRPNLFVKEASGASEEELLLETEEEAFPSDWSKDGRYIVYQTRGGERGWDLWALPLFGEKKPFVVRQTRFNENSASLSPDGRYLVYHGNESGRPEVYVQDFPQPKGKWQVSTTGGADAHWSADGRTIYYRALNGQVHAVEVEKGPTFAVGTPQPLFTMRQVQLNARSRFRPTPDGQRFLALAPLGRDALRPITVVLNWGARLGN